MQLEYSRQTNQLIGENYNSISDGVSDGLDSHQFVLNNKNNNRIQQPSNNLASNNVCLNETSSGTKTSDLGDDEIALNSLECDNNNMMINLSIQKDAILGDDQTKPNELDHHLADGNQPPHHPQCHQAGCCNVQTIVVGGARNKHDEHSEDSDQLDHQRGGSVIGLTMAHPNGHLKRPDSTTSNGIIKQAKKSVSSA